MKEVVIVEALRTPVGSFNGSLSNIPAHDLGSVLIKEIVKKLSIDPSEVSETIIGQVLTAGQGQNPARQAHLNAGLHKSSPSLSVNQVCGSGLRAVSLGTQHIKLGEAKIILAGGQESMSMSPHLSNLRFGKKMGNSILEDSMIKDGLWDAFYDYHMGITAENIAEKWQISRKQQDEFAVFSQNKAEKALENGSFNDEIVPVEIISKKDKILFDKDEYIKKNVTIESISRLRPAFKKDGTVTAANSSGLNDGAAIIALTDLETAKEKNFNILGKIVSYASVGLDPRFMGMGPVEASKKALSLANWKVDELDLIEANEAFAAQACAVNKEMSWDPEIVNVNGGAIAIGHPIGASGARILVTLIHEMKRQNKQKGIATLCIGGGQGVAMCIERP